MVRCAAAKKKGERRQCASNAMTGHTLCGTHARAKNVELWKDTSEMEGRVVTCQSVARRWLVQYHLRMAGPGVLCRKDLSNDEELVTCTEASRQYPLDYFAFEENGKVWWFDFASIWVWSLKSLEPSNPYTRHPLSQDVRKRLREMWALRSHRRFDIPTEPVDPNERLRQRWICMCQAFADNGFTDVSLEHLIRLGKASHVTMWRFLREDCALAVPLSRYMLSAQLLGANSPSYVMNSVRMLTKLAVAEKNPYTTIFNIMSAIYRC